MNALGHAHPTVLSAITGQIATLGHVSNFFATPAQVALAARLVAMSGADDARVFFTNSGTEANEAAFKITRATGRTKIISTEGAFHGRSMGALALTHNPKYREPFEPLPGEVIFVPYGDIAALSAAMADDVAAVVLEPIQGENGIVVPPAGLPGRRPADCVINTAALLWIDEVQTGIGRTGDWLAHRADGVRADVITVAKGLGNGFPIGACIAAGRAASLLGPGSHGSTFGGNPVAAIAGLAVIAVIERDGLLAHATAMGEHLASAITVARTSDDHRRTRPRPAARRDAHRADRRRQSPTPRWTPGSSSTRRARTYSGWRRRLIITAAQLDSFVAGPAQDHLRGRCRRMSLRHFLADDDLSQAEQTTVLDLADALKAEPYKITPYAGPRRSRCSSTSRPCEPRPPSRPASPSSAATR